MNDLTRLDIDITIERNNLVVRLKELGPSDSVVIAFSSMPLEKLAVAIAKHQQALDSK